jgi:hypothetical protein
MLHFFVLLLHFFSDYIVVKLKHNGMINYRLNKNVIGSI